MGTDIALVCPDGPNASHRLDLAERWLGAYENRLSRFIPYSELSRLNASAGRPFKASPLLFDFVRRCLDLAARSGGIFDPTLLHEIEAAGYDRTFDSIPAQARRGGPIAPKPALSTIGMDPRTRTITLPAGLGIDSGGLGKGWAADRVARYLGDACVVDCGGDIAARGSPPDAGAWYVGVQDPFAPERDLALIAVSDAGVATSSVLKRSWRTEAGAAHHLIDSRTGLPSATDVAAATVITASATMADFYAKVALLKGAVDGISFLERESGVEGLLVSRDGSRRTTTGFERYVIDP